MSSFRDSAKAELRMSVINLMVVKLRKLLLSLFFFKFQFERVQILLEIMHFFVNINEIGW